MDVFILFTLVEQARPQLRIGMFWREIGSEQSHPACTSGFHFETGPSLFWNKDGLIPEDVFVLQQWNNHTHGDSTYYGTTMESLIN